MRTLGILIFVYVVYRYGRHLYNAYIKPMMEGGSKPTGKQNKKAKKIHVDFDPNAKKEGFDDGEYIDYEEVDE